MSLVIKDTSVVPPESWTFTVTETSTTISVKSYVQLYPKIVQHCQSNNVTSPSEQEVIDALCRDVHVPCFDSETRVALVNKFSLGLPNPPQTGCCGRG